MIIDATIDDAENGQQAAPGIVTQAQNLLALQFGLFAQTPGMFVRRLRCVSVTTGGPIGVPRATLRGILLCLVVPAVIMDEDRRGWHDRLTGSVIVDATPPAAKPPGS